MKGDYEMTPLLKARVLIDVMEEEKINSALAEVLWDISGGGKDFHAAKANHSMFEGYDVKHRRPYYPQIVEYKS